MNEKDAQQQQGPNTCSYVSMICIHFFRSHTKLELVEAVMADLACSDTMTMPQQGDELHPRNIN